MVNHHGQLNSLPALEQVEFKGSNQNFVNSQTTVQLDPHHLTEAIIQTGLQQEQKSPRCYNYI